MGDILILASSSHWSRHLLVASIWWEAARLVKNRKQEKRQEAEIPIWNTTRGCLKIWNPQNPMVYLHFSKLKLPFHGVFHGLPHFALPRPADFPVAQCPPGWFIGIPDKFCWVVHSPIITRPWLVSSWFLVSPIRIWFAHILIYIYIYTIYIQYIYTVYIHIYTVYIYIVCIYIYVHTYSYGRIYTHTYLSVYLYLSIYISIYLYIYISVSIYIPIYIIYLYLIYLSISNLSISIYIYITLYLYLYIYISISILYTRVCLCMLFVIHRPKRINGVWIKN